MCLARPGLNPIVGPRTPLSCLLASSASYSSPMLGSVMAIRIQSEMASDSVPDFVPDPEYNRI